MKSDFIFGKEQANECGSAPMNKWSAMSIINSMMPKKNDKRDATASCTSIKEKQTKESKKWGEKKQPCYQWIYEGNSSAIIIWFDT